MENRESPRSSSENKQFSEHARTDELVVKLALFYKRYGQSARRPRSPSAHGRGSLSVGV